MSDADGTYPLELISAFVERLRGGADLVIGSRFKGTIDPGAMPWPNRYIGNPILTGMLNLLFRSGVSDAHCGLRAIRKEVLPNLKLSATGMEFASEMVIKAGKRRLRVEEIPIDYHPRVGESKLSPASDALATRSTDACPQSHLSFQPAWRPRDRDRPGRADHPRLHGRTR